MSLVAEENPVPSMSEHSTTISIQPLVMLEKAPSEGKCQSCNTEPQESPRPETTMEPDMTTALEPNTTAADPSTPAPNAQPCGTTKAEEAPIEVPTPEEPRKPILEANRGISISEIVPGPSQPLAEVSTSISQDTPLAATSRPRSTMEIPAPVPTPDSTSLKSRLPDKATLAAQMPFTTRHISETQGMKVENCIGFAQIPVGLAGPLTITGDHQNGTFFAPLATVEATLVASCSRGCKAFQAGGGIHAVAMKEGMSRAPVFKFCTVDEAVRFYKDLDTFADRLKAYAEKTSRFAKLERLTPHIIGASVHVKFEYSTGDAAGQNMVTIATHVACMKLLEEVTDEYGVIDFQIDGTLSSDKKMSWGNVSEPRGVQVLAWGVLSDETCRSVLKVPAERLYIAATTAIQGGIRNGLVGSNVNTANVMTAMFIATGQDAASVLEGGWTHTTCEYSPETKELTVSLFIPSLLVGTVGGGTHYPTQREALELLGCTGQGKKWTLAETIASFMLALEVSTMSAIASDTFAQSHQRLARGVKK